MLKKLCMFFGFLLVFAVLPLRANDVEQVVSLEIPVIDLISVSGNPSNLILTDPIAGEDPDPVSDSSTTWAVTTNGANRYIVASLDSDMPANTTLSLEMAAPSTGASTGAQLLSSANATLVDSIDAVSESGMQITYTFSAIAEAGNGDFTRTVTLSILSN